MKAFLLSLVALVVLSIGAALVLEGWVSENATDAHAEASARPGPEATPEARRFQGEGTEDSE